MGYLGTYGGVTLYVFLNILTFLAYVAIAIYHYKRRRVKVDSFDVVYAFFILFCGEHHLVCALRFDMWHHMMMIYSGWLGLYAAFADFRMAWFSVLAAWMIGEQYRRANRV